MLAEQQLPSICLELFFRDGVEGVNLAILRIELIRVAADFVPKTVVFRFLVLVLLADVGQYCFYLSFEVLVAQGGQLFSHDRKVLVQA